MTVKLKKKIIDKTQVLTVTKLKYSQWQNSSTHSDKIEIATKLNNPNSKKKLENSNCSKPENSNCDQLKNSNCSKTQKLKLWQNLISDQTLKKSFGKNKLTSQQPMINTLGSILGSCDVFFLFFSQWTHV